MAPRRHSIPYGRDLLQFEAEPSRFTVLRAVPRRPLEPFDLERLLVAPTVGPSLDRIAGEGRDVLIVLPPPTRRRGLDAVLPLLLERLGKIGAGRVRALVGAHRGAVVPAEDLSMLLGRAADWIEVLRHDPARAELARLEDTSRGTPVALPPEVLEAEVLLTVGSVHPGPTAGVEGGPGLLMPGLGSVEAIEAHLSLADPDAGQLLAVSAEALDANPLLADRFEAASRREPDFAVELVTDVKGRPVAGASGVAREAFRSAVRELLSIRIAACGEPRPLVVASLGGAPLDREPIGLLQGAAAGRIPLADEGVLVLAGALSGWETQAPGLLEREQRLLAGVLEGIRAILVSEAPDAAVEALGFLPAPDLASALARAEELLGEKAPPGVLIRQAREVVPVAEATR